MVGVELLVFTLVRGPAIDAEIDEAVRDHRAVLRRALRVGADAMAYDVVPDPGERWVAGGVEVVTYATDEALARAMPSIARARSSLPAVASVSFRAFATERHAVRGPPVEGIHTFSSGGMATGFDRPRWQARWREHARLLDTTPGFSASLTGYVQHHGIEPGGAAALGLDDTHGIAQMTYPSAEERAHALVHPEYVGVLRPDEDQFVARDRGMRVFVTAANVP
jgi:EthD domain